MVLKDSSEVTQKDAITFITNLLRNTILIRFSSLLLLRLNLSRTRKLSHFKTQSFLLSLAPASFAVAPALRQQRQDWKLACLSHRLYNEFVIQKENNRVSMLWHQMVTWVELHRTLFLFHPQPQLRCQKKELPSGEITSLIKSGGSKLMYLKHWNSRMLGGSTLSSLHTGFVDHCTSEIRRPFSKICL